MILCASGEKLRNQFDVQGLNPRTQKHLPDDLAPKEELT